jgi:endo-beta-N-acetylglucosaminidase D
LEQKQRVDIAHYDKLEGYIINKLEICPNDELKRGLNERLQIVESYKKRVTSTEYLDSLVGSIGADPFAG